MGDDDFSFFRSFLIEQKSSILNKTLEFKSQELSDGGRISDDAEIASRDLSMSMSLHLHERDRQILIQIEKALAKIANGTFGQCEGCGKKIEIKRLKARPFAALCIECMEEKEESRPFLN